MTQETRRDLRFPMLAAGMLLAAAASLLVAVEQGMTTGTLQVSTPTGLLIFGLLAAGALIAEAQDVVIPGAGAISISYPLLVATTVCFGPVHAASVSAISLVPFVVAYWRAGWPKLVFNLCLGSLTALIPGVMYLALGGRPLMMGPSVAPLALLVAGVSGTVVNLGIGAIGVSTLHKQPLRLIWKSSIAWMVPSQLVLGFVGIAIGWVLGALGWQGFALFVLPLLVARQTYQRSMSLREAYADTIRSLVGALEAKDVYTKGHSVRVAEYAVMIAEALNLDRDRVRHLEQAALLHDIGKVGVSRRVLAKEAKLTDSEYAEIKRHPDIGAHILADVPYLADLVPAIQNHHKRYDGGGYGGDLGDSEVPFEARILAVADSYDAMTSARPYRGAMSHEDAIAELHRNSGGQFDPTAVAAFDRGFQAVELAIQSQDGAEADQDES